MDHEGSFSIWECQRVGRKLVKDVQVDTATNLGECRERMDAAWEKSGVPVAVFNNEDGSLEMLRERRSGLNG